MKARIRFARALLGALTFTVATGAVVAPIVLTQLGASRARACFQSVETARTSPLPDCTEHLPLFSLPSRVPWTRATARYQAEELVARQAIARYVDASVGAPDPERRASLVMPLLQTEQLVATGSKRLVLEELGEATAAPRLGHRALDMGDRRTLVEHYDRWAYWQVRLHALEAALTEGNLEAAQTMAARYAEFDPREPDLRVAVGALLCMGREPKRGLGLLERVPEDRAGGRHANYVRHFGEVWMLIEACAARAKVAPPAMPPHGGGGVADAVEARAVLRVELAGEDAARRHAALEFAEVLLSSLPPPDGPGLAPGVVGARAALLATLIANDETLDAERIAALARPRSPDAESPLSVGHIRAAEDLWNVPLGLHHPELAASVYERAGERCLAVRDRPPPTDDAEAEPEAEDTDDGADADQRGAAPDDATREAVTRVAGAFFLRAGIAHARAGRAKEALAELGRGGELAGLSALDRALLEAAAHRLAGDPEATLKVLASADDGAREPQDASEWFGRAAVLLQRAEALAALGRAPDARAAALSADLAATRAGDSMLSLRTRWTRLALAPSREDAIDESSVGATREPTEGTAPRWAGHADRLARWARPGYHASSDALLAWRDALFSAPAEQLAFRYELLDRRGDAPDAFVAYSIAAGRLLPGGPAGEAGASPSAASPAVETWLDALLAFDARRMPMRAYAWSRAEAARARGDQEAAIRWTEVQKRLTQLTEDPGTAIMARYLRL